MPEVSAALLIEIKKLLELIKRSNYYREGIRQYRPRLDMLKIDELHKKLEKEMENVQ